MAKRKKQRYNRLPDKVREAIIADLGTAPDAEIAERHSKAAGFKILRYAVFALRDQRGIAPFAPKAYTKPAFHGRLEDAHPEICGLIGKVPVVVLAERYGVARGTVAAAAKRLGHKNGRVTDHSAAFEAAGAIIGDDN